MADTDTEPYIRISSTKSNPKKLFSQFIFKSAIVTLFFLVILPLFSSQAPDFIHQSFNTRSWELLQLVLVGIAVSYGLFSQKTEDSGKEHSSTQTTFDNAHSYVSKFLEVSSVFDDETESPSGSNHDNKIESWNSQYFREEPMVVVAQDQESSVIDQERRHIKPILLPVRSLNSRVPNSNIPSRSSSSKNLTRISNENVENVVLRSPIPWRSRSGNDPHPPLIDESNIGRFKSRHDITEESPREKIYYEAAPPPPPPPPPPTKFHSLSELKSATQKKPNTELVSKVRSFVPVSEKKENPILVEDKRSILNQRTMVSSSDDDDEEEDEEERRSNNGDDEEGVGPDVNKQADEFIAKFREQIRLQRIDEIKRSTKRNSNK